MASGQHEHGSGDNYHSRIVRTKDGEALQLICLADGVIYRELLITQR